MIPPVVPIGLYLLSAFLVPVVEKIVKNSMWVFSVVMSTLALACMVLLYSDASGSHATYWLGNWVPVVGTLAGIGLVLDPLSWLFGFLIALFGVLAIIYSKEHMKGSLATKYYVLMFLACAGSLGVVLTGDLFNLFVFLELYNFVCIALIAYDGKERSLNASMNMLVLASLATTFLLVGIIMLYAETGTLNIAHIAYKLGLEGASVVSIAAMVLIFVGIGVKASFFPLHTWMPEAYSAAPHGASMLLIGMKYGTGFYALLRLMSVLFGFVGTSWLLVAIGLTTLFAGVIMAMVQTDFKRMLSYHAISQLGYMVLAAGLGTTLGMTGSLFHVLNNVIYKGMLFMVAGAVIWRTKETDVNKMGGLAKQMPVTALAFAIGALAISGVPPFNGFASKWIIYNASFSVNPAITALALLGSALTLASFLKVFHAVFLGSGKSEVKEAPVSMIAPMMLLALLCILIGLFPDVVLEYFISPAVKALVMPGAYIRSVLAGMV